MVVSVASCAICTPPISLSDKSLGSHSCSRSITLDSDETDGVRLDVDGCEMAFVSRDQSNHHVGGDERLTQLFLFLFDNHGRMRLAPPPLQLAERVQHDGCLQIGLITEVVVTLLNVHTLINVAYTMATYSR